MSAHTSCDVSQNWKDTCLNHTVTFRAAINKVVNSNSVTTLGPYTEIGTGGSSSIAPEHRMTDTFTAYLSTYIDIGLRQCIIQNTWHQGDTWHHNQLRDLEDL